MRRFDPTMIEPLGDRVVVRELKPDQVTRGGIVLPCAAREKPSRGIVLAVGPGKVLDSGRRTPMAVSVGDQVVFAKWAGNQSRQHECSDVRIMDQAEILAVVG